MCTKVKHPTETDIQKTNMQKLIKNYHAIMHAAIGTEVVVDTDDDNVFVYNDKTR